MWSQYLKKNGKINFLGMKVLVLGDGLLGSEIVKQTEWDFISRKKNNLDIKNFNVWMGMMDSYDIILNCIANTDTYSKDRDDHWELNYKFVYNLIDYCNVLNKKLIHISTDYLYTGSIENATEEDVPVHCNNWYGYTKLLGDGLVQLLSNDYLICRCTHKPTPFPYENAWSDQIGNFDYVNEISSIIIKLINENNSGVFNVGTETKTMYALASKTKNVTPAESPNHVPKNTTMSLDKLNSPFFSVAIPTYGYNGRGSEFLNHSLEILSNQTFKDFEVVISDHSIDDTIFEVVKKWESVLKIKYLRNEHGRGIISPNINNAMSNCSGKWIKILFQDDYLNGNESLEKHYNFIINNPNTKWFAAFTHVTYDGRTISWSFNPKWVDDIWTGNNKIGSPTNVTIHNKDLIFFDEDLNWLMDVEYYMRMRDKYGDIKILNEYVIVNRISPERLSNNIPESIKNLETEKLKKIYA
jgi:dTDP-4-dehydrorhamnose reductase